MPSHRTFPHTCQQCGVVFYRRDKGRDYKYCSYRCSGLSHAKEYPQGTCEVCGKPFRIVGASRGRFCSQACYHSTWPSPRVLVDCVGCGARFKQRHRDQKYCAKSCAQQHFSRLADARVSAEGKKLCSYCQQYYPLSEFNRAPKASGGVGYRCSKCRSHYYITRTYGITPDEYQALRDRQSDRCAICGVQLELSKRWKQNLDHCHKTGAIRGFLCNDCNRGLGCFHDSPRTMRSAVRYLIKHAPPR